jgi:hypothetical protein
MPAGELDDLTVEAVKERRAALGAGT